MVEDLRQQIVGYFFLRPFVNGKCFRGRIADYCSRGKGIGKLMAKAVSDVRIIKTLDNGYYYIECKPKN